MSEPPTLGLDESLAKSRAVLHSLVAKAPDEYTRQWLLLQLALHDPLQRWLYQSHRMLPKTDICEIVAELFGALTQSVLVQAGMNIPHFHGLAAETFLNAMVEQKAVISSIIVAADA